MLDTSALLPTDTNVEIPRFSSCTSSRIARPRAPLCVEKATRPSIGVVGENVAFSAIAGSVLMIPMQLGPIMRIPAARTFARISSSRTRPAVPVSPNPALMTTSALTPFAMQSSTTPLTPAHGTQITARSTSPGMAVTVGNAGTPSIDEAYGCTTDSRPGKPPATMLCRISEPILPRSRLAPMTATACGAKKFFIDAVAASRDRSAAFAT